MSSAIAPLVGALPPADASCLVLAQGMGLEQLSQVLEQELPGTVAVVVLPRAVEPGSAGLKALQNAAERIDIAVLLDARLGDGELASSMSDAEGVLCWARQVKSLRAQLGKEATIVVDAGISRHDAMVGAEAGASAIWFNQRGDQQAAELYPKDDEGPQSVADLYMWWEQIMEIPAVLDLGSLDQPPSWLDQAEFVAVQITPA